MHFKIPHKTTKFQATQKVKEALEHARPQLKGNGTITEERWDGSTFHFAADLQGKTVTGTLAVTDTDFVIDAKLPLMWRLFEGRIEKMILEQVKQMM
ncbi:MAG: polyhydroxyalkanoic acid system family protein [Patescibacteria group bacterium]